MLADYFADEEVTKKLAPPKKTQKNGKKTREPKTKKGAKTYNQQQILDMLDQFQEALISRIRKFKEQTITRLKDLEEIVNSSPQQSEDTESKDSYPPPLK